MFKSQLTAKLPLQKPTPDILVAECGNVHRWLTGTMVHPSQGVRQHTDEYTHWSTARLQGTSLSTTYYRGKQI